MSPLLLSGHLGYLEVFFEIAGAGALLIGGVLLVAAIKLLRTPGKVGKALGLSLLLGSMVLLGGVLLFCLLVFAN